MSTMTVVAAGFGVSVQDTGRPGFSDLGLGAAGAADRAAAALANRIVGNPVRAAVLEAVLGSVALRADGHVLVVVTGAAAPVAVERADGRVRGAAPFAVVGLEPGDVLRVGVPAVGLRTYVAVRGGVDVAPVLGSRSWDSLARLGPPPLRVGDVVPVGRDADGWPVVDAVAPPVPGPVVLDVLPGPRDDWFAPEWRSTLSSQEWTVTQDADRIGVRTSAGRPLRRADGRVGSELASEGVETGSLQVPPDGFPVLFLADHPVTGGYPVVGVVTPAAVDRAAQLRPGDRFRFRVV